MEVHFVGYSGHSFSCINSAKEIGYWIKGYFDIEEKDFNPFNLQYLGSESNISTEQIFISIGDNSTREKVYRQLPKTCDKSLNIIHPSAYVSKFTDISDQVLIQNGSQVNALTRIDQGVIINTSAIIEHECKIGAFAHIAPGAVLAGNVIVGERSFIGANATVIQGVKIGKDVIIGAGSVVINDVPDFAVVVGNPGKIIKYNK